MGKQNKVTKSTSQETIDLGLSSPKKDRTDEILALITQSNANNNKRFDDLFAELASIKESHNARLDAQDVKIKDLQDENKQLKKDLNAANLKLGEVEVTLEKVNTKVLENESHSRRLNLIFSNVPESRDENIRETLNRIFIDNLGIAPETAHGFLLRDAHRLGKSNSSVINPKPRNIILAFVQQSDRNYVYSQARKLKGSNISMRVDLIQEYAKIRDNLLVHRREILKNNDKTFVQLSYKSYNKPILLVKVNDTIVEFKDDMDYADLENIRSK